MDKIGQLLERGFSGGIVLAATFAGAAVFLYLVYRLTCFFMGRTFLIGNGYCGNCGLSRTVQRVTGLEIG